jgi:hypothetical protein
MTIVRRVLQPPLCSEPQCHEPSLALLTGREVGAACDSIRCARCVHLPEGCIGIAAISRTRRHPGVTWRAPAC